MLIHQLIFLSKTNRKQLIRINLQGTVPQKQFTLNFFSNNSPSNSMKLQGPPPSLPPNSIFFSNSRFLLLGLWSQWTRFRPVLQAFEVLTQSWILFLPFPFVHRRRTSFCLSKGDNTECSRRAVFKQGARGVSGSVEEGMCHVWCGTEDIRQYIYLYVCFFCLYIYF